MQGDVRRTTWTLPAMVFVGIFMMPFYYGSRARSVPEYLKLRFDEKTRGLNAISFAVMTIFSSGVSMYAMGKLFNLLLGWNFNVSMIVAALIVLAYTFLGGLTSAIYNEALQFFLIVLFIFGLVMLMLGWRGATQGDEQGVHPAVQSPEGRATEAREHRLGLERER